MELIDTHAHIYLPEFENELPGILNRAQDSAVHTILMPAIDSSTHEKMVEVEDRFEHCHAMIGLHPCSVNQDVAGEIEIIRNYLEKRAFVAIGEIGLDFYWDKTFTDQQYQAFREQISLARDFALPIVIHSRNATDECIQVVKEFPGITGVFHCFSGTYDQAMQIMDMGLMLGIGGVLTFKNAGLDKVIRKTGIERVVLETDAPYLAPVPYRGKRNEPAYIRLVAEKLAQLTELPLEKIADLTTQNAKNLFKL